MEGGEVGVEADDVGLGDLAVQWVEEELAAVDGVDWGVLACGV